MGGGGGEAREGRGNGCCVVRGEREREMVGLGREREMLTKTLTFILWVRWIL